jgi:hypothetical protein
MATPIHGKKFAEAFNSVTLCTNSFSLDISADVILVEFACLRFGRRDEEY